MSSPHRLLAVFLLMLLAALITSCSKDSNPAGAGLDPPDYNISGSWWVTEIADESDCGGVVEVYNYGATVAQDGNDLTVTIGASEFDGSISASTVSWLGSFPEDGGVTSILNLTLVVADNGNRMEGTSYWSWTDGEDSCTGTSQISADKTD